MNNSSIRNRDLTPLLNILFDSKQVPNDLINIISDYAKSNESIKFHLFVQVKGESRHEEEVYVTIANLDTEYQQYFNTLRNQFELCTDAGESDILHGYDVVNMRQTIGSFDS